MRRRRRSATLVRLALPLLILACGKDSDPVTDSGGNLDPSHAAQATIGAGGGSLTVTDAGGTMYRLDVPPGALSASTTMIATPFKLAAIGNDMTPLAPGIRLQPAGLIFESPATMVVTVTGPPTGDALLLLHRSGSQPGELLFATAVGNELTTDITHFSDVTPAAASFAQLIEHWNLLMGLYELDGPSSDIAFQLGYTFLTAPSIKEIPKDEWEADLNEVLTSLVLEATINCKAGECTLGNNQLNTVINIAAAMNNTTLVESAESQKPVCDTGALDVSIGFDETIESGVPSPLVILVALDGTPIEGATVEISVAGGSAAVGSGETDASGQFSTTVSWDGLSSSVDVTVMASHTGCPSPGNASDSATPSGLPGGVVVESRDSEVNLSVSASYNLNPGNGGSTTVYDVFAFVENADLSGEFSSDTTRTANGEGGGMTMSGRAQASQTSSVIAQSGNSVTISFAGDVSGDASLANPPGGDATWQSYSAAFSDLDVSIRVFSASVPFQLTGSIDGSTDVSFTGESVSICIVDGQVCANAVGRGFPLRGLSESGELIGDPDGGNLYRFTIRVERRLFYQQDSSPPSGNGSYSGMANVVLTIGQ